MILGNPSENPPSEGQGIQLSTSIELSAGSSSPAEENNSQVIQPISGTQLNGNNESGFMRGARWLEPRLAKVGAAIAGAASIIWGPFVASQTKPAIVGYIALVVGYVILQVYEIGRSPAVEEDYQAKIDSSERQKSEMENKLVEAEELLAQYTHNQDTILTALLRSVVEHDTLRKLLGWSETDRINLFYPKNKIFDCLARYSVHPEFKKRGQLLTSLEEGYLAKAYLSTEGYFHIGMLPCYDADKDLYEEQFSQTCGLPRDQVKKIRMKPRSILVCSIYDVRKENRMALCVLESQDPNKFSEDKIREKLTDLPVMAAIRDLIELAVRSGRLQ